MKQMAKLTLVVEYDPETTDAESVASMLDVLLGEALSTEDVDCEIEVGSFEVDSTADQVIACTPL